MRTSTAARQMVLWSALAVAVTIVLLAAAGVARASSFGITKFTLQPVERTEEIQTGKGYEFVNKPYVFTQAGGHPWGLTTTLEFTSEEVIGKEKARDTVPTQDPKDAVVSLPAGLLGNPQAVPRCSLAQMNGTNPEPCPADTQVGWYVLHDQSDIETLGPIVNVTPAKGQSAEFALEGNQGGVLIPQLTAHLVRTPEGYGFSVASNGIPMLGLLGVELTFWGVPADPSHDQMRRRFCSRTGAGLLECEGGGQRAGVEPVPFLSMPTDCAAGPELATVRADSWEEPGRVDANQQFEGYVEDSTTLPGVTGCDLLSFEPQIEVQPNTLLADEPVELGVNIKVPQPETPQQLATPHLRDAVVTLPEGMSVSPGVVDGIRACEASGPEGINFTGPESEEIGPTGELQLAPGHCPEASVLGSAEAITPLLESPVKGTVYLARPGCGGPGQHECTNQDALDGNLYQIYLELGGSGELADAGIQIKVAGKVQANPATGQLTAKFLENPQAPFSELRIHLNGGARSPIDNSPVCGPAVTTADFTPWSAPGVTPAPESLTVAGTPDATPSSFFEVQGCQNPAGLQPGFLAGTVSPQAGSFSAFTLNISRQDREQYLKGIQVHTPPGLLGMLSSVPLCDAADAEAGTCPQTSRIGSTRVASGAGSHPFEIEGSVYLTGPYNGAPFGLSVVTDAVAGPFNLGRVVVRARIDVDPQTSELTITTDESGPHAIPQIIFGVPLRLQRITVDIDRPNFMFNPTNCSAQQITAKISGAQQAVANVQTPFVATGCRSLAFKPHFTVSTSAHTSRTGGASLDAKLSYPAGSLGNEANIASVKVQLPKQLPSRLATLQKACTAATFEANAANCPPASIVGVAKASTPLLPVSLAGPVYFVSHGGEAFPSLIVVLQGDGVRVDLTGSTFISHQGIISSTFKTVPDVPVSTFELYLPEGQYSALTTTKNLCNAQSKLKMPTEFTAQNGTVIRQTTKITVNGCHKKTKEPASRHKRTKAKKSSSASSRKEHQ